MFWEKALPEQRTEKMKIAGNLGTSSILCCLADLDKAGEGTARGYYENLRAHTASL